MNIISSTLPHLNRCYTKLSLGWDALRRWLNTWFIKMLVQSLNISWQVWAVKIVGYSTAMLPCAWRWWNSVYTACTNLSSLALGHRIWAAVAKADSVLSTRQFHNFKYSLLLTFVNNVTGCEPLASCYPAKTMQIDASGSVPEVIRHKVIVGSVHSVCL